MMYYHMNETDRLNFLNYTKPKNLPPQLADNLADNLKQWISGTYAPAYVSFMLSQTPTSNITWDNKLTDPESAKIWYWFSGSVSESGLINAVDLVTLTANRARHAWRQLLSTTR